VFAQINPNATDPASWAVFFEKVGFPGAIAVMLLIVCCLLVWQLIKALREPSNGKQVELSDARHKQLMQMQSNWLDIVSKFAATKPGDQINIDNEVHSARQMLVGSDDK
jgi:hypothetical protein